MRTSKQKLNSIIKEEAWKALNEAKATSRRKKAKDTISTVQRKKVLTADGKHMLLSKWTTLLSKESETLVINFWFPWCPPCIKEFPWFKKVIDEVNAMPKYKNSVKFVAINTVDWAPRRTARRDWPQNTGPAAVFRESRKKTWPHGSSMPTPRTLIITKHGTASLNPQKAFRSEKDFRGTLYFAMGIK